jgi:Spy/CpxP family protein refolding chaperone
MSDRGRALTMLTAVFLLGCMLGAACVLVWGGRVVADRGSRTSEPLVRGDRPLRLVERLKLTPDQEKRVREILGESRKEMDALRAESAPRFAAIRSDMDRKIEAILNDQQKQQFQEFLKEMASRRDRMHHRPEVESRSGRPPK